MLLSDDEKDNVGHYITRIDRLEKTLSMFKSENVKLRRYQAAYEALKHQCLAVGQILRDAEIGDLMVIEGGKNNEKQKTDSGRNRKGA